MKVSTGLSNLKTKIDELDIGNLKTIPIELKKFSDVVSREVEEKTVYDELNTKTSTLGKKIPD